MSAKDTTANNTPSDMGAIHYPMPPESWLCPPVITRPRPCDFHSTPAEPGEMEKIRAMRKAKGLPE